MCDLHEFEERSISLFINSSTFLKILTVLRHRLKNHFFGFSRLSEELVSIGHIELWCYYCVYVLQKVKNSQGLHKASTELMIQCEFAGVNLHWPRFQTSASLPMDIHCVRIKENQQLLNKITVTVQAFSSMPPIKNWYPSSCAWICELCQSMAEAV